MITTQAAVKLIPIPPENARFSLGALMPTECNSPARVDKRKTGMNKTIYAAFRLFVTFIRLAVARSAIFGAEQLKCSIANQRMRRFGGWPDLVEM